MASHCGGGQQLAVDTTLVSPLSGQGQPVRRGGRVAGAALAVARRPGCAAHRPGKRDAPAGGMWARSASKVPRGGRVPPPALQSSGPAACLRRDEAKAVMVVWVSWADHLPSGCAVKCKSSKKAAERSSERSSGCRATSA